MPYAANSFGTAHSRIRQCGVCVAKMWKQLAILIALIIMMNSVTIGVVRELENGQNSHGSCVKRHNFALLELRSLDS